MGRKEDFLQYPDLMGVFKIAELIILFLLIGLSFLRAFFVCKGIDKKISSKRKMDQCKVPLSMRLFFACVIAELSTYIYFCVSANHEFLNQFVFPIARGLHLSVWWDLDSWKLGLWKFIIGVFIWSVLDGMLSAIVLHKSNLFVKEKAFILLKSILFNLPFVILFQLLALVLNFDMCLYTTNNLYLK